MIFHCSGVGKLNTDLLYFDCVDDYLITVSGI